MPRHQPSSSRRYVQTKHLAVLKETACPEGSLLNTPLGMEHQMPAVLTDASPGGAGPQVCTPAEAAVEVHGVSKTFGAGETAVHALEDVSIAIRTNEFFTLLGPSGCGKTTLLRLIAGFEHPTQGAILLQGEDISTSRRTSGRSTRFSRATRCFRT